ncbi:hypothetical protein JW911_03875 [Candidatus Peregrinibacteria bacterium]|nr:hypothetical protein [Candidatus Peregrinibacteria bacterium]
MKIKISKSKILLLFGIILLCAATVHAQGISTSLNLTGELGETLNRLLSGVSQLFMIIIRLLQKILWPMFIAIGGLLNNDLIFGAGMEERLLGIWTQVRNIVNIGFVVVLLGIALYNVTGFAKDNYEIKTFLPKFAMALIAVNFSYVVLKAALDVTSLLTTAIFAMPASISNELQFSSFVTCTDPANQATCTLKENDPDIQRNIQTVCKNLYGSTADWIAMGNRNIPETELICTPDGSKYKFTKAGIDFFTKYSSRNAAMIIAIQFMNVVNVDQISESTLKNPNIASMAFNLLFSIILYVVYGAAYVALFVVLLARIVVLWMVVGLSPIWALGVILPTLKESGGGDLQKQFINNAVAPIKIGIALTIGYIMLEPLKQIKPTQIQTALNMQSISLETSGISNLQYMIVAFAAVAVVWIGVFKAAESTAAAGLVQKIKGAVSGAGRYVGQMWKYLPVGPTGPGGQRTTYAQMVGAVKQPFENIMTAGGYKGVGGTVTPGEIKGMTKPKQLQEAIASKRALEQENTQKAVYEQLSTGRGQMGQWGRQKLKLIGEKIGTTRLAEFQKGKLKDTYALGQIRQILAPGMAAAAGAAGARGATPPGTKPAPAATGTQPGAQPPAGAPTTADQLESALLTSKNNNDASYQALNDDQKKAVDQWLTKRTQASGKPTELKAVNDELTKDPNLKGAVSVMAKTKSEPQIKEAVTNAGAYNTKIKPQEKKTARQELVRSLNLAHTKLAENGVKDINERKRILGEALTQGGVTNLPAIKRMREFRNLL